MYLNPYTSSPHTSPWSTPSHYALPTRPVSAPHHIPHTPFPPPPQAPGYHQNPPQQAPVYHYHYPPPPAPIPPPRPSVPVATVNVLPKTDSIPELKGRESFPAWREAIETMAVNHQLFPHIAPPTVPGAPWDPMETPVYRPLISPTPSQAELDAYALWYGRERTLLHILTSRLSPTILPTISLRSPTGMRLTAREVLHKIETTYGVVDYSSAMVLIDEMEHLSSANLGIRSYIDTFSGKFNTLVQAKYPYDGQNILRSFMLGLPSSNLDWHAFCDHLSTLVTTRP
ncbi:hypothetical protein BKA70DRAFT_1128807, partial [Coprinopsis sp. MPI-PUGE-AT-0042]